MKFTNTTGTLAGLAVQNLGNTTASFSGMLFYDQFGALAQFQGFNNVTHEYRINNVASNGSIHFLLGGSSMFKIAPHGRVGIGTATPTRAKLEINGDAGQYTIQRLLLFGPTTVRLTADQAPTAVSPSMPAMRWLPTHSWRSRTDGSNRWAAAPMPPATCRRSRGSR